MRRSRRAGPFEPDRACQVRMGVALLFAGAPRRIAQLERLERELQGARRPD